MEGFAEQLVAAEACRAEWQDRLEEEVSEGGFV